MSEYDKAYKQFFDGAAAFLPAAQRAWLRKQSPCARGVSGLFEYRSIEAWYEGNRQYPGDMLWLLERLWPTKWTTVGETNPCVAAAQRAREAIFVEYGEGHENSERQAIRAAVTPDTVARRLATVCRPKRRKGGR